VKILVTVKRVPDPESALKVNAEGTGFVRDNLKWVVNPFDEIAVEEGLRIGKTPRGSRAGQHRRDRAEQLRTGLAMGADRAVRSSRTAARSLAVARCCAR
jgi:electron transfer flavoprotein beta subunit